jgi:hypothetical protein
LYKEPALIRRVATETSFLEDIGSEVHDCVDSAELLPELKATANQYACSIDLEELAHSRKERVFTLQTYVIDLLLHGSFLTLNELRLIELAKHLVTFACFVYLVEVDWGLRHEKHAYELQNCGHRSYAQHPSPFVPKSNADKIGDELA